MLYLDTSALAKLVVREAESTALRNLLAAKREPRFSSALAHAELLRAARRFGAEAMTTARQVLAEVHLIDVTREVLENAGTIEAGVLRTLDAVHLATAALVQERLEAVVTYDRRMQEAAHALGFEVVAPGF